MQLIGFWQANWNALSIHNVDSTFGYIQNKANVQSHQHLWQTALNVHYHKLPNKTYLIVVGGTA